ncbi:MAG: hypothetical protein J6386_16765 [Candidatus Synoicihabitans palmerolidicus]|nr:hypothetical protein [Candidatus Synoicihabitans palmerolidicus]
MNHDSIAIIGMAGRCPGSINVEAYEQMLADGRTAFQPVPAERWNHQLVYRAERASTNHTPAKQAGFVDGMMEFCPEYFGLSPKRARIMDPQQRLVLETARQALDDAGYRRQRLARGRTGV